MRQYIILVALSGLLYAQANTPALQTQIAQDFAKFKSDNYSQRYAAFADLTSIRCSTCKPSMQILDGIENAIHSGAVTHDEIASHLIELLTKEADYEKEIRQQFDATNDSIAPPGYYDYLGDLLVAVIQMRDPRSLDVLFDFLDRGGMVANSIASFGDPALKQTLTELDSPESVHMPSVTPDSRRLANYVVLSHMAEAKNLQKFSDPAASRAVIKNRLLAGVSESSIWVRSAAVKGLGKLGDPDLIPVLESVAAKDPSLGPKGEGHYLVREEAQRALSSLKKTPQ